MSIRVENITYIYGGGTPYEKTALAGVDLTIEKGEFVGIIGHTGSGKSTLIQHLNGLIHPTKGRVLVDGVDLAGKSKEAVAKRHTVGMVFQYPEQQLFEETVAQDIAFGPRNLGCDEETVEARVREAMSFVGLDYDTYAGRSPFRLSGGQMRRVAIAGVIAMEPECIVLDEATAMLDPAGRREVIDTVLRLNREQGITVVLITHHMVEAERADRVIVMNDGEVAMDGMPRQVFSQVERLHELGLAAPDTVELLYRLRRDGVDVPLENLTVDECADTICRAFGEAEGK